MHMLLEFKDGDDRIELTDNGEILSLNHIAFDDLLDTREFARSDLRQARNAFFGKVIEFERYFHADGEELTVNAFIDEVKAHV